MSVNAQKFVKENNSLSTINSTITEIWVGVVVTGKSNLNFLKMYNAVPQSIIRKILMIT